MDGHLHDDIGYYSTWASQCFQSLFSSTLHLPVVGNGRVFEEHSRRARILADRSCDRAAILQSVPMSAEILRRNLNGKWRTNDDDPEGEINVRFMPNSGAC